MTDHDTATDRDSMAARRRQDGEIIDLTLACTLFEYAVADRDARIAALETQAGQAYTDIAAHEERETELQIELSKAREDNACLLTILRELDYADPAAAQRILDKVQQQEHPGRSLMAWMTRRHYAAQALAEVARAAMGAPLFEHREPLARALAEYDDAQEARQE